MQIDIFSSARSLATHATRFAVAARGPVWSRSLARAVVSLGAAQLEKKLSVLIKEGCVQLVRKLEGRATIPLLRSDAGGARILPLRQRGLSL